MQPAGDEMKCQEGDNAQCNPWEKNKILIWNKF
jgi:hypothetical protein